VVEQANQQGIEGIGMTRITPAGWYVIAVAVIEVALLLSVNVGTPAVAESLVTGTQCPVGEIQVWSHSGVTKCAAESEIMVSPSTQTLSVVATLHFRSYIFDPKDDITAPELAKIMVAIMPAMLCHNVLGCDVSDAIAALPPEAKRHFVEHNE
jgi:hypothetical protein